MHKRRTIRDMLGRIEAGRGGELKDDELPLPEQAPSALSLSNVRTSVRARSNESKDVIRDRIKTRCAKASHVTQVLHGCTCGGGGHNVKSMHVITA